MVKITVDRSLTLFPANMLPTAAAHHLRDRLTFPNPAFLESEKRGFSTWNIPQQIKAYQVEGDPLIIPRGFTRQVVSILHRAGVQYRIAF